MRLFIAIPMPDEVKQHLVDLQQPIDGVRWQNSGQFHLTLKFLGETGREHVSDLQLELGEIDLPAFSMSLKGFGYFPKGKQPRVIWTGIEKSESLVKLQQDVETACTSLGFDPEDRSFKPHITIGRVNSASKRDVMSFVNQHKQLQIRDFAVNEFVLYESKLHPDGATHYRVKTFKLKED